MTNIFQYIFIEISIQLGVFQTGAIKADSYLQGEEPERIIAEERPDNRRNGPLSRNPPHDFPSGGRPDYMVSFNSESYVNCSIDHCPILPVFTPHYSMDPPDFVPLLLVNDPSIPCIKQEILELLVVTLISITPANDGVTKIPYIARPISPDSIPISSPY